jgi:hypothetical protein
MRSDRVPNLDDLDLREALQALCVSFRQRPDADELARVDDAELLLELLTYSDEFERLLGEFGYPATDEARRALWGRVSALYPVDDV